MNITIQLPRWAIFATQDNDGRVDVWSGDPILLETTMTFVSTKYECKEVFHGTASILNWRESKVDLRTHDAFINDKGILCKVERSTELPSMLKPQHDL